MKKWKNKLMKRMNEKPKKPKDPISKKTDFFGLKKILWTKRPYPKGTIIVII